MTTIGIPKTMLYFRFGTLWEEFFRGLDCDVIVSPETNQSIMNNGLRLAIDESCLSIKIFLGHVEYLKDKVDHVLIPNIVSEEWKNETCIKFWGMVDIARNTFDGINILDYTVNHNSFKTQKMAFLKMGMKFSKNPIKVLRAYENALKKLNDKNQTLLDEQNEKIKKFDTKKSTILIVSRAYVLYDKFIGGPIHEFLESQDVNILHSNISDKKETRIASINISKDVYWTTNKELLGAIHTYRKHLDGILYLMSFPCGPDSLVVDLCMKKIKDIPQIVITLDELQGTAGLKTRLESFVDILNMKKCEN